MFVSEKDLMFQDGLLAKSKIAQRIYRFKTLQSIKTFSVILLVYKSTEGL